MSRTLSDAPSFLTFPGEAGHTLYGERMFVGYRGFDAAEREVAFAFGHGLSYTDFRYSDLRVASAADEVTVRVCVTNTGARPGREVVQVYAGLPASSVSRPPRWLVGFGSVEPAPGQAGECDVRVAPSQLAYWHTRGRQVGRRGWRILVMGRCVESRSSLERMIGLSGGRVRREELRALIEPADESSRR